jgi:hypothetical protein
MTSHLEFSLSALLAHVKKDAIELKIFTGLSTKTWAILYQSTIKKSRINCYKCLVK